jgi:hypothetical protein
MMNIQCANPNCQAELKYLRGGRLYLMEREPFEKREGGPRLIQGQVSVRRYFWLCPTCAETHTLRRWTERGVELTQRHRPPVSAMARAAQDHDWMIPGLVG